MNEEDSEQKLIEDHVNRLMEHFDTVQIFVSRQDTEENVTHSRDSGAGHWYARYGQVNEWIIVQDERARHNERKNK